MNINDYSLGNAIKFMRKRKNLSSRILSSRSGLSPSYISKVEAEKLNPSFDAFCSIIEALGLSDGEIIFLIRINQRIMNEAQCEPDKKMDGLPSTGQI